MTKIAVIGAGYWGKKHVHDYIELGVKPIVCDLNEESLKFYRDNFGVETTTDYRKILSNREVVGASICTPNETHYKICKEFLETGKNVLLEKPMTLNSKEAEELVKIAREKHLVLAVGHVFRFNNALRKIKEMLEKKELGDVFIVKLAWTNLEPIFEERDVLFDLAPHPFDIVHFLFEKYPTEISCIGGAYRRNGGEEAAFVNCKIDSSIINLEISWLTPQKNRTLTIVGSKKTAFADCLAQTVKIFDNSKNTLETLPIIPSNSLREELKNFLERIKNRKLSSIADGEVGVKIIKMIETARRSLDEKKTIKFVE
ncbi:MAG: Gfo/Idh/MocA family oxidoreductase [Candidatus Hydrothermarchaeota archaeon]|nr:Gfo/Idh/MocA family oxidoreductase [Candidatus Hydrothermarchaeota archaeon]